MKKMLTWCGFRIVIRYPTPVRPKWYDFPRKWGWRSLKSDYAIEKGQTYLDNVNHIMYVRSDDAPALMEVIKKETPPGMLQDPGA